MEINPLPCDNKDMLTPATTRGNAFLYVLIAVILLGALSFAISRSNDSSPSGELSDAGSKTAATSILAYEAQARTSIDQMIQNGSNVASMDFILPSGASFNTAPTINKLFHPDGGGLQLKPLPKAGMGTTTVTPAAGYYIGRFNNVIWTPTTSSDVIFTAWGVSQATCAELNRKIAGNTAIPTIGINIRQFLLDVSVGGQANVDLTSGVCAACNERPSFCVTNGSSFYAYYSILVAR